MARITFKGKMYYLGAFQDKEEAVRERKKAEERLFQDFLKGYYQSDSENEVMDIGSDS